METNYETYPCKASQLREGGYVNVNNNPCKIVDITTSKNGKHGGCKVNFTGIELFSGVKHEKFIPSHQNIDVPVVKIYQYTVINIDDEGYLSLLDVNGSIRADIKIPKDEHLKKKISKLFDANDNFVVFTQSAMGSEEVYIVKELLDGL
eukprot:gene10787-13208_t